MKDTRDVRDSAGMPFLFVGERLWLNFVNTELVDGDTAVDLLGGFDEVMRWCVEAGIVTAAQGRELARGWSERDTARAFAQAIALRGLLRELAERLASGRRTVPAPTLEAINGLLRERVGEIELARTAGGYETRFRRQVTEPVHLLVPIAESAAELLSHDDLALLKKCQNPRCVLVFYDTTKNHARRWCSMTACGNRAKVAAHYRRSRKDTADAS